MAVNPPPQGEFPTVSIQATDAVKVEGASGSTSFTFTLTRTGNTTLISSVDYAVSGSGANPAVAGDFTGGALPSGTVTFASFETSKQVTINVAGDSTFEFDEGFIVTLSAPSVAIIGTSTATGTILNDDAQATLSIAATDANKVEGNSGSTAFTFTVTRAGDTSGACSANWAVTGSGANPAGAADFAGGALPTGTVAFAAGETSKLVTVNVAGDGALELNEGFTVTLSGATGAGLGTASAAGTIQNDDTATTLAISGPVSLAEGASGSTAFVYTVSRSGDTTGATSVNYAVTGSGATAGDFTGGVLPGGTVNFAAGETSKLVTVNVAGDGALELNEGFTVTLSGATGAGLGTASAAGTIQNDDTAANVAPVAVADTASVSEDASVNIDVLANDTDADVGDAKSLVSVSATAQGATVVISGGQVVYTADPDAFNVLNNGQSASDSFTYVMRDAAGLTSSTTVTVTIHGVADAAPQIGGNGAETLIGTPGDESIQGGNGADRMLGGDGADTLGGGNGDDALFGEAGIDSLSGGKGADTLNGGAGDDALAGGRGGDLFVFAGHFGDDTVIDFKSGEDGMRFEDASFLSFADFINHAAQVGSATVVTNDLGYSVTFLDTQIASLRSADFLFVNGT